MRFNMIFPLIESRSLSVQLYFDGPFPDKTELNSWHLTPCIYSVGAGVQYIQLTVCEVHIYQQKVDVIEYLWSWNHPNWSCASPQGGKQRKLSFSLVKRPE